MTGIRWYFKNVFYLWLVSHKVYTNLNIKSEFIRNLNIMIKNFKFMLRFAFLDFSNHLLCKNLHASSAGKNSVRFQMKQYIGRNVVKFLNTKIYMESPKNISRNLNTPILLLRLIFKYGQILITNVDFIPKLGQNLHCIWYYDETKMEHKSCSRVEL